MTKRKVAEVKQTQDFPRKKTRYDIEAINELYESGLLLAKQRHFTEALNNLEKAYEMCIASEQDIDDSDSNDIDGYFSEKYIREDELLDDGEESEDVNYEFKKIAALSAFRLSGLFYALFITEPNQKIFHHLSNYTNESAQRLQTLIAHTRTTELEREDYIYYLASLHENFAFVCNKLNRFEEEARAHLTSSAYYLQINQLPQAIRQAHLACSPLTLLSKYDEAIIALEKVYKIYQQALKDDCQEVIEHYADKILGILRELCNTLLNTSKYELAAQYLEELYQHAVATKTNTEIAEIALISAQVLERILDQSSANDIIQKAWYWADKAEHHYRQALTDTSFNAETQRGLVKALFIKGALIEEYHIQASTEELYREAQSICALINDEKNLALAKINLGKCIQRSPKGIEESIQLFQSVYYEQAHKAETDDLMDGLSLEAGLAAYYLGISYLKQTPPQYEQAAIFFREAFNYLPFSEAADFSFEALALAVLLSLKGPTTNLKKSWNLLLEHREEFNDDDIGWALWLGCAFVELSNEAVAKVLPDPDAISHLQEVIGLYDDYIDLEYTGNDEMIIVLSQILARHIGDGYKLLNDPVRAEEYYSYSEQFISRCTSQEAFLARIELMQSRNGHQNISYEDIQKLKELQKSYHINEDRAPEFNLNKGNNFHYRVNKVCEAQRPYQCQHFFFQLTRTQEREDLTDLEFKFSP
ncbi:hypothetical protein [Legionella saoudiensis]|uniref:hypothetical protein n=1 Tax=Legionella saoudiensis TaxID=1750561 RepID=UPI00072FB4AC|nr:hypothetical protein [Legionella saoudiensis]